MKIYLRRRHALTVADGASSHKIDNMTIFKEILNSEGHPNRNTGSKVTAILLNWWILPIGGASSGRVCACSLRSRLVYSVNQFITKVFAEQQIQRSELRRITVQGWLRNIPKKMQFEFGFGMFVSLLTISS